MMISTRGRYALRVMIDLAEQNSDGYVSLREIAKRQEISEKYLETIVRFLTQEGLVSGVPILLIGYSQYAAGSSCIRRDGILSTGRGH